MTVFNMAPSKDVDFIGLEDMNAEEVNGLMEEALRIDCRIRFEREEKTEEDSPVMTKEGFKYAGEMLQNIIMRNRRRIDEWSNLVGELAIAAKKKLYQERVVKAKEEERAQLNQLKEEMQKAKDEAEAAKLKAEARLESIEREEKEKEVKSLKNELEEVKQLLRGLSVKKNTRKSNVQCFNCLKHGHFRSECNSLNKNTPYLSYSLENANCKSCSKNRDVCCGNNIFNRTFSKKTNISEEKNSLCQDNENLFQSDSLETLLSEEFPTVFKDLNRKIEFCGVEVCNIKTEPGKIVIRKGVRIEQSIREQASAYIKSLVERGVISSSLSGWRNPIRFLRKENGEIRLVSNFMKLNDITEKDGQEIPTAKEVIQSTIGSKFFFSIGSKRCLLEHRTK